MATLEELSDALIKADRAGNTDDARALTAEIDRMRGTPTDPGDLVKSAAIGPVKGAIRAAGYPSDIPEYGARGLDIATRYIGGKLGYDIPERQNQTPTYGAENLRKNLEQYTGPLYEPKTTAGHIVQAGTEALGDPTSYIGPGTMALKLGSAVGGQGAAEAAGQAIPQDSAWQIPGRIAAGAVGGFAANKMFGPRAPVAKLPDFEEVAKDTDKHYKNITKSDVLFSPDSVRSDVGAAAKAKLLNGEKVFDPDGSPRTFAIVEQLNKMPSRADAAHAFGVRGVGDSLGIPTPEPMDAFVTTTNLDRIRRRLGNIAGKTEANSSGRPVPTEDAAAAMVVKNHLEDFFQHPPKGAVLSGDVAKLQRDTAKARASAKTKAQMGDVEYRSNYAEVKNDQNLTGSLGQKLQTKIGDLLLRPKYMKNLSPKAQALVQAINTPSTSEGVLRQVGRLTNWTPLHLMTGVPAGVATSGASIPYSIGLGGLAYGARHLSDKSTISKVDQLLEVLASESPLYKSRVKNLKPMDTAPGKAALVRGLLQGFK